MLSTKLTMLFALFVCGALAEEIDSEGIKKIYCSEDAEVVEKFKACVENLPEAVLTAKKECAEEAAPEISEEEELRTAICDDSTGVGEKFHECMEGKKAGEEDLSDEDKEQLTGALQCLAELLR